MASLLGWIGRQAKGVIAQANPFDNGQTYSTVMRQPPRPAPPPPQPVMPPNNQNVRVAQPLPTPNVRVTTPYSPSLFTAPQQPGIGIMDIIRQLPTAADRTISAITPIASPLVKNVVNVGRQTVAKVTNNQAAQLHAADLQKEQLVNLANQLRFFPRAAAELGTSLIESKTGKRITLDPSKLPTPLRKVSQAIIGDTPIQTIQQNAAETAARHPGWKGKALAGAYIVAKPAADVLALASLAHPSSILGPKDTNPNIGVNPRKVPSGLDVVRNNPAVQSLENHITLLDQKEAQLAAQGLSPKSAPRVANAKARQAAVQARNEMATSISQGGYIRVPRKGESQPLSGRKVSSGKQPQIPTPSRVEDILLQGAGGSPGLGRETRLPKLPQVGTSKLQTRGFFETILNDSNTKRPTKQALLELDTSYKTHNMRDLQTKAANLIKTDPETAVRIAKAGEGDMSSMVGSELIKHYGAKGQHEAAIDMAKTVAANATKYGQANAALASYAKLTPDGILRFTQKELNKYNKQTGKNLGLSTEKAAILRAKSQALQKMEDGYGKEAATQDLLKEVYTSFPATWAQKVSTLQTMAQLFNPKTLIRNVGGNAIFGGLENISQTISTPLDKLLSTITGKRTTGLPSIRTQAKAGFKGLKTGYKEATKGINTGPGTQFDLPQVPTFRGKTLGNVEKGLNVGLRATDRAAYEAAVADSLRSQMKASKVTKPTTAMIEEAQHTGLYRTFQDDTRASRLFVGLKKVLNILGVGVKGKRFGLGDIVLKYPKTPGNLLARGLDYSPVGFVKSAFEATKPLVGKPFNQKKFVDSFSRAVTGSSVAFGMGYVLADNGIITAKPNQDKDLRNLQKKSGLGGYQINASGLKRWVLSGFNKDATQLRKGDSLVSYDWAQPASIPLSAGAALGSKEPGPEAVGTGLETVGNSVNTLVEQPLLQGVQKLFGGNANTGGAGAAFTDTLKGLPSSFTPTLISQINQAMDNTTRNTRDPNLLSESLNMVKAKVPGLAQTLPPNYDVLGSPQERYQGGSNNLINVFLNPAFMSKYNPDQAAQLPLDIYNNTGEKKQAPRTVPKSVEINGKTKQLTGQEMSTYQKWVGERTATAFRDLAKNPSFSALSDEEKANKMSNIMSDINTAAKIELFGDKAYGTDAYNPTKVEKQVKSILGNNLDLNTYLTQSPEQRTQDYNTVKDAQYKSYLETYNQKIKENSYTPAGKLQAQYTLKRLKVGSNFDKNIRDLYSLSKTKIFDYVSKNKEGDELARQLINYDKALYNAGLTQYMKFRTGLAPSTGRRSSGGGGRKRSVNTSGFMTAGKSKSPTIPKIRTRKLATPKFSTRKISVSKIPSNYTSKRLSRV